jgi:hypothetical protein
MLNLMKDCVRFHRVYQDNGKVLGELTIKRGETSRAETQVGR